MRLALCLFRYSPYSGLARDMLRIAQRARDRGHEVTIFTSEWQGGATDGIATEVLEVSGFSNHGRAAAYHRVLKPRLQGRFDAVVGFNKIPDLDVYYAADACFAARARYTRHPVYRLTPRYRAYRRLERSVFSPQSRTHILALSEQAVSEYREFYGTGDSRFTLLPPTLQDRYRDFRPGPDIRARVRADLNVAEDDLLVLMVGSGFHTKGVDRAIRATISLPAHLQQRVRLIIAGSGDPAPFESQAAAGGSAYRTSFLGGRDDVPELMAAADMLLHPARNENTGTVLLEAMAVGLPVLTTRVCGYARHVEEADAGLVLPLPFDQRPLDRAFREMLTSDVSTWRRNGPRYARQPAFFSLPDSAVDAIESVASRRARPQGGAMLYLSDELRRSGLDDSFDSIMGIDGRLFREAPGRRTLRFDLGGKGYFLKTHSGVGWKEIFKNLASLKLPVLGAQNEWHALHLLGRIGIRAPMPLGFGTRGRNPARRESFVIMEEIEDANSLEQICARKGWGNDFRFRCALVHQVAGIARTLHLNGVNHRDFYICHFLLPERPTASDQPPSVPSDGLVLIDLHRAQIRRSTPMRWIVKDLGGLYFSAMEADLTQRDLLRFIRTYCGRPLREALAGPVDWNRVRERARHLRPARS